MIVIFNFHAYRWFFLEILFGTHKLINISHKSPNINSSRKQQLTGNEAVKLLLIIIIIIIINLKLIKQIYIHFFYKSI